MRQVRWFSVCMLVLALLPTPALTQDANAPQSVPIKSFEFLGCGGDWPWEDAMRVGIRRLTSGDRVTYLVRHPDSCGLEGRAPRAIWVDGVLRLDYELYSPSDAVSMCECEYWAKFTFGPDMMMNRKVEFGGMPTILLGDNWPGDP